MIEIKSAPCKFLTEFIGEDCGVWASLKEDSRLGTEGDEELDLGSDRPIWSGDHGLSQYSVMPCMYLGLQICAVFPLSSLGSFWSGVGSDGRVELALLLYLVLGQMCLGRAVGVKC